MSVGLGIGRGKPVNWGDPALWLLRDEFMTPRAAGSVNGTAAEPGPGTRTVTDLTNTKVFISSGTLSIGNSNSWSDCLLSYASLGSRTAGRTVLARISKSAGEGLFCVGNGAWEDGVMLYGNTLRAWSPVTVITSHSDNQYHYLAIASRTAGHFILAKLNGQLNWLLRWIRYTSSGSDTGIKIQSATTSFGVQMVRVPNTLWLPTPIASDGFGSSFGMTDGLGHAEGVAGGIGSGGSGKTWSNGGATWSVSSAKAINTSPSGLSQKISVAQMSKANVFATAALTRATAEVGLALSVDSASNPQNGVLVYLDGTNCKIDKIVGGNVTNVRTTAVTYSAGARLAVVKEGMSYRVFYNDQLVGAENTISDTSVVDNTLHGLYSTNAGNTLDGYTCYATGTSGEYNAALDAWSGS